MARRNPTATLRPGSGEAAPRCRSGVVSVRCRKAPGAPDRPGQPVWPPPEVLVRRDIAVHAGHRSGPVQGNPSAATGEAAEGYRARYARIWSHTRARQRPTAAGQRPPIPAATWSPARPTARPAVGAVLPGSGRTSPPNSPARRHHARQRSRPTIPSGELSTGEPVPGSTAYDRRIPHPLLLLPHLDRHLPPASSPRLHHRLTPGRAHHPDHRPTHLDPVHQPHHLPASAPHPPQDRLR